jgi:hypothetical protein
MIKRLVKLLRLPSAHETQRRREEAYLSKSIDLVELERRQRELVYKENSARYI